jgi:thioredoxin 1
MMKRWMISFAVLLNIALAAGGSHAGEVDGVLAQARKEGKTVMLELGSVGCIPCERMKPVMKKLSDNYSELEVIFIDVRRDRDAAQRFHVFGIPTQVFLDKNGNEFHRHVGYYAYEDIVPALKKAGI